MPVFNTSASVWCGTTDLQPLSKNGSKTLLVPQRMLYVRHFHCVGPRQHHTDLYENRLSASKAMGQTCIFLSCSLTRILVTNTHESLIYQNTSILCPIRPPRALVSLSELNIWRINAWPNYERMNSSITYTESTDWWGWGKEHRGLSVVLSAFNVRIKLTHRGYSSYLSSTIFSFICL